LLKKKVFSSWDQFQIPFPCTKGLFVWGDPIWVTSNQKKDDLAQHCVELERALDRLTEQAELAVQQADPATCFLRATNKDSSTSSR
jgi:hypothetical protein